MGLPQKIRKYRYLRVTHQALKVFAKRLNYKYIPIPGNNGAHITNLHDTFEIRVGKDQPLEDIIVIFSHELGHALDLVHTPMSIIEKKSRLSGKRDIQVICREVAAWGYGRKVLKDMKCYSHVEDRFEEIKETALLTYLDVVEKDMRAVNKKS